jgi:DNA-binding transcriptional MerR regulator
MLRINEVAHAVAVNRETLRYYERRRLIEQPERSPGDAASSTSAS